PPPAPTRAALAAATAHLPDNDPSNEELGRLLDEVVAAAQGRITLTSAGTTNERRPIRRATLGHGPLRICYVTQQHGDEPLGTPAALKALWALGAEDTEFSRWLRSRVTLDIVVRANPDGQARKWRYNYDPGARPTYGQAGKGYDINRYHDPATPPEKNPAPEAGAIQRLWLETKPSIIVDYHMQGAYTGPDGRTVTASILWPTHGNVSTAARDRGRQLAVLTHATMTAAGATVTRYPGDTLAGIARNAYGLRGSGSLLVELSRIQGREAFQIQSALDSMVAIARSAADGSLDRIDPAEADAIPGRGRHGAAAGPAH
ncbi:MAG TPA: M14 family zinc carboxypeptidase, partial [Pilimelia sp.]|nr:M14 family zinc carboxypeptidase [Pilimelia sp.]